ncbi:hypothetical protein [Flammeovirga sp. EKP202]|uniref:hypothetical protein n=1 Tax=Flammeovirga sp. EKP202 TaxID=2770592 RepID=UPI00165FD086|nr:hypothetical protein [Flammeovirga sp. EKP202]MBD0401939.1 hypothetical protein [Flammeovirga sp. EKP202]
MASKNKGSLKNQSSSIRVNKELHDEYKKTMRGYEQSIPDNYDLLMISTILQEIPEFEGGFEETKLMKFSRIVLNLAQENEHYDYVSALELMKSQRGKDIFDMCTTMAKLSGKSFNEVIPVIVSQIEKK